MKFLKTYWYYASLKHEESRFTKLCYLCFYAIASLASLYALSEGIKIMIQKQNFIFPYPLLSFIYFFTLFIAIITREETKKVG